MSASLHREALLTSSRLLLHRVLMSDADPYLGWIEITADDAESFVGWTDGFYSVREISPKKSSYPVLPADAKGALKVREASCV